MHQSYPHYNQIRLTFARNCSNNCSILLLSMIVICSSQWLSKADLIIALHAQRAQIIAQACTLSVLVRLNMHHIIISFIIEHITMDIDTMLHKINSDCNYSDTTTATAIYPPPTAPQAVKQNTAITEIDFFL